mmetsp:Transcript_21929/g.45681  ORF Transcript_21929/g.45681 Transcript_21929/m.45681 type:complete len:218 (-) Transcript_21929:352-1005(-)
MSADTQQRSQCLALVLLSKKSIFGGILQYRCVRNQSWRHSFSLSSHSFSSLSTSVCLTASNPPSLSITNRRVDNAWRSLKCLPLVPFSTFLHHSAHLIFSSSHVFPLFQPPATSSTSLDLTSSTHLDILDRSTKILFIQMPFSGVCLSLFFMHTLHPSSLRAFPTQHDAYTLATRLSLALIPSLPHSLPSSPSVAPTMTFQATSLNSGSTSTLPLPS